MAFGAPKVGAGSDIKNSKNGSVHLVGALMAESIGKCKMCFLVEISPNPENLGVLY